MKLFLILCSLICCSCQYKNNDDLYVYDGENVYYNTIISGDLTFYIKKTYQYGNVNIITSVVNNSPIYIYNFYCEIQVFQNGFLIESSNKNYIYDLFPGQSQNCCYINTRYTNDQNIKFVLSDVTKTRLSSPQ